jgi:pectinesterase
MERFVQTLVILFLFGFIFPIKAITVIVAQDGSGDFLTIQSAINAQRAFSPQPITIRIKAGTYHEKLVIYSWLTGLTLIGEDAQSTIITWNDFSGMTDDMHTFNSYSVLIAGDDLRLENLTFENTAGQVGQAVAAHVEGDRVVFVNCRFLGDQDTVYLGRGGARQLFLNCYIEGTTDFIFGPSTAVFKNCIIHSKWNSFITAASTPEHMPYGYVFLNCKLTAQHGIDKVYLGRPWRDFAKTVFVNCEMGSHIRDEAWHNWARPEAEKTVFYAEYGSVGPGAVIDRRVSWSHQLTSSQVEEYSIDKVLGGSDNWRPLLPIIMF